MCVDFGFGLITRRARFRGWPVGRSIRRIENGFWTKHPATCRMSGCSGAGPIASRCRGRDPVRRRHVRSGRVDRAGRLRRRRLGGRIPRRWRRVRRRVADGRQRVVLRTRRIRLHGESPIARPGRQRTSTRASPCGCAPRPVFPPRHFAAAHPAPYRRLRRLGRTGAAPARDRARSRCPGLEAGPTRRQRRSRATCADEETVMARGDALSTDSLELRERGLDDASQPFRAVVEDEVGTDLSRQPALDQARPEPFA